ncbi:MAG: DMT family transporter [Rhodospirillum sp.]|nr:DMT family transporter [Rhodospirillum sp.]MCF8490915.1 DMT family transporter [Rhodospirillum sp.]MCF8499082.1 DMT family transporter [Rhodospirillum sp.]
MTHTESRRGIALAFICLCILGIMPILSNGRPSGIDALTFAFFLSCWQVVFALPLFLHEFKTGKRGIFGASFPPRERTRITLVTLITGILFGLSTYLYVLGVEKAGAVSGAIAIQAYPLFAILWESLFLKRRKTPLELLFTAGLVIALVTLGTGGTFRIEGLSPWFLVTLVVPFLWSIAHVIIREELGNTPITPVQVTFVRVVLSTLFLGGLAASLSPDALSRTLGDLNGQTSALAMGFAYTVELIVWFHAMRFISVSTASSITTPWPALTMILSAVFLGEVVTAQQIGVFVVVVVCIYGLIAAGHRAPPVASPRPEQA